MERVGHKIRELRNERKWSQAKLAEEAGISDTHVGNIENYTKPGISLAMYQKVADALDISLPLLLLENGSSEVLDSIIYLLADRPKNVQENALELIEVLLKAVDNQQPTKES